MADNILNARVKNKTATSAEWAAQAAFVPLKGEIIYYSDLRKMKVGDGVTALSSLAFVSAGVEGAYTKPSDGIPKTDLASSVQTSLNKADTALQSFTETDPVFSASAAAGIKSSDISNWNGKTTVTESTVSGWGFTKNTGTYSKPSGGIPKTDLESAVQTSLSKSDTAVQTIKINNVEQTKTSGVINLPAYPTTLPASDVKAWAKADAKPTYTASEVGALASTVTHLSGDIATSEKGANNGVATLGSDGKIPSSQLPSYVDDVLEYSAKSSFPTTGETGKIYVDTTTNKTYRWSGSAYVEISASIALGETSSTAYAGDKGKANADAISTHTGNGDIHVTTANKTAWNAKYNKPSTGIPKSDLASAVQTSLGKADSALQSFTETDPVFSASAAAGITSANITSWNNKGTYSKPSGGIPKTDLASAVQTSLGKADTALQSFTETDPTVPSWAKAANKPTYTASEVGARPSTWTPSKSDIGLGNVGNFKAVSTVASQGLTSTEQANARANIGAGTSSFSGSYNDLTNKPTIPAAQIQSD